MKKIVYTVLALSTIVSSTIAFAEEDSANSIDTLTVVNHFSSHLDFNIDKHHEIVPGFPGHFLLNKGESIKTVVKPGFLKDDHAYIETRNPDGERSGSAFWAVQKEIVRGYLATGLAFSWNQGKNVVLTFCTPEDYAKHGKCL